MEYRLSHDQLRALLGMAISTYQNSLMDPRKDEIEAKAEAVAETLKIAKQMSKQ